MSDPLPSIDLASLAPGMPGRSRMLEALGDAARNLGFFRVVAHGVPARLDIALLDQAARLFALPHDEKLAIAMLDSPQFRGYTCAGAEITCGKADWREQLDIGREESVLSSPQAHVAMRLHGPNRWPATLPTLRPVVQAWQSAIEQLMVRVLEACAEALHQPRDVFAPLHRGDPWHTMKLIRYPGETAASAGQGVGAHKDGELLSLIFQDSQGGLQVQTTEGGWIEASPQPGSYVVNIGEQLELASDGYLKAAVHRVISPPVGRERLSAAFFLGARLDSVIPSLQLPPALAAQATGYTRDPDNPLFHDVGVNTLKGRLRSHPDVAARHHADLL